MALLDNIKKAREKQNFSQEYVAEKLGVSRQAVSKWETGQAQPSTQNLLQLAELLKVDANILLNDSTERKAFIKEDIEQKGLKTVLNKKNAIFLISSCVAQLFIFGVNVGNVGNIESNNMYKFLLAGFSFVSIVLLLWNIWFKTSKSSRSKLLIRVFLFTLFFNLLVALVSNYLGGVAVFVVGILMIVFFIKIKEKSVI